MPNRDGQIIILNGAPRSGKSSIVKVIQETWDRPWMNLGVDVFKERITPQRYSPAIGLRPGEDVPDLEKLIPVLYAAMYESIAAHSRLGLNVVVDVGHHDSYSRPLSILTDCAKRLTGLPTMIVGVRCPIEQIMKRLVDTGRLGEWDTGSPIPNPILRWQREVHKPGIYDLELDTSSLSPTECADRIREQLDQGPMARAIEQLAAMP